jgi:hypothetical protein
LAARQYASINARSLSDNAVAIISSSRVIELASGDAAYGAYQILGAARGTHRTFAR